MEFLWKFRMDRQILYEGTEFDNRKGKSIIDQDSRF
jgi:hypothetical protein